jgi:hypothetical protein
MDHCFLLEGIIVIIIVVVVAVIRGYRLWSDKNTGCPIDTGPFRATVGTKPITMQ